MNIEFFQMLFLHLLRWSRFLIFSLVNVVYDFDRFAYVEPSLWTWDEFHLVVYDLFDVFLKSFGKNLVENFYIYIYWRYWPIMFFFGGVFGFGIRLFFFLVFFAISWATPVAKGDSQARGPIGAAATSLHQSHSNVWSEPCLQPAPQLTATPDCQPTEQGQGPNPQPMVPSRIR